MKVFLLNFSQNGVRDDGADGGGEGPHVRAVEPLLPCHQGPHRHNGQGTNCKVSHVQRRLDQLTSSIVDRNQPKLTEKM